MGHVGFAIGLLIVGSLLNLILRRLTRKWDKNSAIMSLYGPGGPRHVPSAVDEPKVTSATPAVDNNAETIAFIQQLQQRR